MILPDALELFFRRNFPLITRFSEKGVPQEPLEFDPPGAGMDYLLDLARAFEAGWAARGRSSPLH